MHGSDFNFFFVEKSVKQMPLYKLSGSYKFIRFDIFIIA